MNVESMQELARQLTDRELAELLEAVGIERSSRYVHGVTFPDPRDEEEAA